MKEIKFFGLMIFMTIPFLLVSCKKKSACPENEAWAPGTWKISGIVIDGQPRSLTDTIWSCYAGHEIRINTTGNGDSWDYYYYSPNRNRCVYLDLGIISWAENKEEKILYITDTTDGFRWTDEFLYTDSRHMKFLFGNEENYLMFSKIGN